MFHQSTRRPLRSGAPRTRLLCALLALGTAALAAAPSPAGAQAAQPCVGPAGQQICGFATSTTVNGSPVAVNAFMGIRYATAPRWQNPTLLGWTAQPQATTPGSICPQGGKTKTRAGKDTLVVHGAEDCLFLNVWRPTDTSLTSLPVMVFIHGGAFVIGSGSSPLYDGGYLAASGNVVVVSLNYRLGVLGFLRTTAVSGTTIAGNMGLLDQQAALQWVQANVSRFGGDPAKVTIFGESAGAMSVGFHLFAMPGSKGLFRAAIMESNPMGVEYRDAGAAAFDGGSFVDALCGVAAPTRSCPRSATWIGSVPLDSVILAQTQFGGSWRSLLRVLGGGLKEVLPWTPTVDGTTVAGQPYDGYAPGMPVKPLLFGMNRDEGVLFAALAQNADSAGLTPFLYGGLVARMFLGHGREITTLADTVAGGLVVHPYQASSAPPRAGLASPATALADVVTDFAFDCGNLAAADSAYQAALAAAPAAVPQLYGYHFVQRPAFAMFDAPQCFPGTGQVCHAAELPYVFNTFAAARVLSDSLMKAAGKSPPDSLPSTADSALARSMGAAWTTFATTLQPPASWQPYSPAAGQLYTLGGSASGTMASGVGTAAHCQRLWSTFPPLGPSAARSSAAQTPDPARLARSVGSGHHD